MSENGLVIKKLRDRVYLFDEEHKATGYLVIGDNKAIMIDTMFGGYNLMDEIRKLTDKPVEVINTHYHSDHILGNIYFDRAYIHPADKVLAEEFCNREDFKAECLKYNVKMAAFDVTGEGDVFDLGGISLKIYDLPGHTPGGIVILCPEERILFTGDGINHFLWMQLDCCISLKEFIPKLERIRFLEKEADYILHGHAGGFDDISLLSSVLDAVKEIVDGKREEDSEYEWFGNVDMKHPFKVDGSRSFDVDFNYICYKESNIM